MFGLGLGGARLRAVDRCPYRRRRDRRCRPRRLVGGALGALFAPDLPELLLGGRRIVAQGGRGRPLRPARAAVVAERAIGAGAAIVAGTALVPARTAGTLGAIADSDDRRTADDLDRVVDPRESPRGASDEYDDGAAAARGGRGGASGRRGPPAFPRRWRTSAPAAAATSRSPSIGADQPARQRPPLGARVRGQRARVAPGRAPPRGASGSPPPTAARARPV